MPGSLGRVKEPGGDAADSVRESKLQRATQWFRDRNWTESLSVARLQRSRAVGRGVRVAIVLPLVLATMMGLGYPRGAFLAAFATTTLLITSDISGPRRERAVSMAVIAAAGCGALILGLAVHGRIWVVLPVALILGTAVALVGALRGFLSQGTVPILLPFVIAATSSPTWPDEMQMVAGWCCGSVVSIIAAVTMWPYFPRRVILESITESMKAQARLMRALWRPDATQQSVAEEFAHADAQVSRTTELYSGQLRRPGSAYRRERFLIRLVEESKRLRIGLRMAYRRLPLIPAPGDATLVSAAAQAMDDAADAAAASRGDLDPFRRLDSARAAHRRAVVDAVSERLAAGDAATVQEDATSAFRPRVLSLLAETMVRDAGVMHSSERVPHLTLKGRRLPTVVQQVEPGQRIKAELSLRAPWMRNALRVGIAVAVALLAVHLTGVDRGYWVVLGTLSVLRMDLRGTGKSAWQVIQGQLIGFVAGFLLLGLFIERPWLAWVLLPVIAGAQGYMANNVSVVWQQVGFTLLLVTLVSLSAPSRDIALLRLEDVVLGMLIAVVVSLLVFPRGLVPRVRDSLLAATEATADFLVAATQVVADRAEGAPNVPPPDGAAARKAAERAAETIDLALAQGVPQGTRTLLWQRLLGMVEYVTYISEVMATVGKVYAADLPAAKVGLSLRAATANLRPRLSEDARQLLAVADLAVDSTNLPDYPNTGEFTAAIDEALAQVDAAVTRWAEHRRVDMAEPTVELYWTVGWLAEVDLMIANNSALIATLTAESVPQAQASATS